VKQLLDNLNLFFAVIFAIELFVNLFSHWLRDFVCNSW
jgi:hypothetical protein